MLRSITEIFLPAMGIAFLTLLGVVAVKWFILSVEACKL